MSLEEFARTRQLDQAWLDLRLECNQIVASPDYWYRKELQDVAREFAVKASDILAAATRHRS